jgi:hypothetical protein
LPTPRTYDQWKDHFLEEAEFHYAELVRLGYHVSQPFSTVQTYCSFAAFDAIHLGKTEVDFERARDMAERLAGVSSSQRKLAA